MLFVLLVIILNEKNAQNNIYFLSWSNFIYLILKINSIQS